MTTETPSEMYSRELMQNIVKAIFGSAKRIVGYVRQKPLSPVDRDMGRYIINALDHIQLSSEQLDNLEKSFIQEQQHMIGWIFSILDQGLEVEGLPKKVSLVNIDSNEEISDGRLNDIFTEAFFDYAKKIGNDIFREKN
jgi:hypothetical protein